MGRRRKNLEEPVKTQSRRKNSRESSAATATPVARGPRATGKKSPKELAPKEVAPKIPPELPSFIAFFAGVIILLALISHDAGDLQKPKDEIHNYIGFVGAWFSTKIFKYFGLVSFWPVIPLLLVPLYNHTPLGRSITRLQAGVGLTLFIFSALALAALIFPNTLTLFWPEEINGGGILGDFLALGVSRIVGRVGALILLPILGFLGFLLFTGVTFQGLIRFVTLTREESDPQKPDEAREKISLPSLEDLEQLSDEPEVSDFSPQEKKFEPLIIEKPKVKRTPPKIPQSSSPGGPYEPPGPDLLDPPVEGQDGQGNQGLSRDELMDNARKLETKLMEFKVEGRILEVAGGPVITMYEYQPSPGTKISKVVGLATDLAMAMKVGTIRVVAPLPGKAAIGLELPNPRRTLVTLRELIESQVFQKTKSPLALVLGVDIVGDPVVTDLGTMPHLLIAGATGSGKSVGLDCMIMSILFKAGPEKVRFLMIDPKCVELALYQDLPHLLYPVLTDPVAATEALKWAVHEMDERYKLMAENGVRNIQGYNEKIRSQSKGFFSKSSENLEEMPYLVIIIDELSDLMLQSPKDVEVAIMRLCAKARAAGIHLILATQRPSVDVLTGVIKANLPTRISFQVATKFDSRTILDQVGAEMLLGKGDMLFMPPGTSKLRRLHGAYVSDEEKKRVTDYIRSWGPPNYLENLTPPDAEEANDAGERDDKYEEAVELVRRSGRATISHIQRHLRIGYNRAARIIEDMEREGIIGPQDGARPRVIF
ncbi:MAG: DNA translocase FtsK 4TM domain-containing protein [Deltaproteobacteria bacterium]|jgi:S-DNA-T family DNA segregation ATPase FtsK/SpoIIIE|nr:DNA translocase FtsK 4TM domain-containing protein [Deltaproteobacteria bacterium]